MSNKGTQFKLGQSGNMNGRPPLPPELKGLRKVTGQLLDATISKLMLLDFSDLKELDKTTDGKTTLEVIAIKLLLKSAKGDEKTFEYLCQRTAGKVKDQLEVSTPKPFIVEFADGARTVMGVEGEESE